MKPTDRADCGDYFVYLVSLLIPYSALHSGGPSCDYNLSASSAEISRTGLAPDGVYVIVAVPHA